MSAEEIVDSLLYEDRCIIGIHRTTHIVFVVKPGFNTPLPITITDQIAHYLKIMVGDVVFYEVIKEDGRYTISAVIGSEWCSTTLNTFEYDDTILKGLERASAHAIDFWLNFDSEEF